MRNYNSFYFLNTAFENYFTLQKGINTKLFGAPSESSTIGRYVPFPIVKMFKRAKAAFWMRTSPVTKVHRAHMARHWPREASFRIQTAGWRLWGGGMVG